MNSSNILNITSFLIDVKYCILLMLQMNVIQAYRVENKDLRIAFINLDKSIYYPIN